MLTQSMRTTQNTDCEQLAKELDDLFTKYSTTLKHLKFGKKLTGKAALKEWKYTCCGQCADRFDRRKEHHKPDKYKSKRKGR